MQDIAQWPAGATYVAQGTVAEDATAGTHLCTLTVTPGAGNEMQVLYGVVTVGNTATSQAVTVFIDDGTNILGYLIPGTATTTASSIFSFPQVGTSATTQVTTGISAQASLTVSGTMRLILKVGTAAISVTQTFAVVCRTRSGKPASVLADTVGTPVLTLNTDKLF